MAQRLRWKFGQYEVEVEGEEAFVEKQLQAFLNKFGQKDITSDSDEGQKRSQVPNTRKPQADLSPVEFYRMKKPDGGTETLITMGKYLHDFRGQDCFTRTDIRNLAAEMRIKDVHSQYYTLALKRGWLRELGDGFAVTVTGDEAAGTMGKAAAGAQS